MQLTHFTDYSIRVLMYLAKNPSKRVTVKEISQYHNISQNHLVKIVYNLSKMGYIHSFKGRGGGIILAKPASDITIGDIVKAIEPPHIIQCEKTNESQTNYCVLQPSCHLKHIVYRAREAFIKELSNHRLSSL